ncbi:MAG: NUDIX domain-containing protein [Patescibacteria group bacterium]
MKPEKDFYQISLKLIMKNNKGQILGLKGVKGGRYENYYDLPGGRIDTNEFLMPFAKIIAREVKEEIGNVKYKLNLKPVALGRHLSSSTKVIINNKKRIVRVFYLCFEAKYLAGKIKISFEHEGFAWLNLNKVNLKKYFKSANLDALKMYFTENNF